MILNVWKLAEISLCTDYWLSENRLLPNTKGAVQTNNNDNDNDTNRVPGAVWGRKNSVPASDVDTLSSTRSDSALQMSRNFSGLSTYGLHLRFHASMGLLAEAAKFLRIHRSTSLPFLPDTSFWDCRARAAAHIQSSIPSLHVVWLRARALMLFALRRLTCLKFQVFAKTLITAHLYSTMGSCRPMRCRMTSGSQYLPTQHRNVSSRIRSGPN